MNYDTATALLVVDMQNDFTDPAGSLYVREGETIVGRVNGEIRAAARAGATVVYTRDCHPQSTPHFDKDGGLWPVHCVANTWGCRLYPDLLRVDGIAVEKGTGKGDGYSAFSDRDPESGETTSTGLTERLQELGVTRVVVVGLALDYCVKATAIGAAAGGFETFVITAATRSVDLEAGDGLRAIEELLTAGVTVDAEEQRP